MNRTARNEASPARPVTVLLTNRQFAALEAERERIADLSGVRPSMSAAAAAAIERACRGER